MPQPSHNERRRQQEDHDACHEALRAGSKTFHAASLLLPPGVREPATVLYAFCRLADDTVDVDGGSIEGVRHLRHRLDRVYAGKPMPAAADRALTRVVKEHDVPREVMDALLEGLLWDTEGRTYETLADLNAYAARVAGAVGAMTCILMDRRAPYILARACDLGVAMQLTNIARDVGEDACNGRLYLPREWMREAGIDPEQWLADPVFDDALASVIQRLLNAADVLYRRSEMGIARLPFACRPAIYAARFFYAEIGRELERRGLDSISQRAVVPGSRKITLLAQVTAATLFPIGGRAAAALDETQFLVDASTVDPKYVHHFADADTPAWWQVNRRVERTLDLFLRLQEVDRQRLASATMERTTGR